MPARRIGILGFENLQALDLVGPADVFGSDALAAPEFRDGDAPPYEVILIGVGGNDSPRAMESSSAPGTSFRRIRRSTP